LKFRGGARRELDRRPFFSSGKMPVCEKFTFIRRIIFPRQFSGFSGDPDNWFEFPKFLSSHSLRSVPPFRVALPQINMTAA
jgi:hypothetical protein